MASNKILNNASWIIVCRIVQAIFSFIISMLTARYLGPGNFGLINYAASMVAFVTPIMQLGIRSILVREIVVNEKEEGSILGTSLALNLLSAILCVIGMNCFVFFLNAGEKETIIVCLLYSITLVFQALEVFNYWFQAKYLSKYPSIISVIAYILVSAYKVFLLVTEKSVYWFSVSNAIDVLIIGIATWVVYKKIGKGSLGFSSKIATRLLNEGKYFIVADLMITVFAQTDRIMLKSMVGSEATGYYSAAITCAMVTQFVFAAVIDSYRPAIFESKENSEKNYQRFCMQLYSIIIYLSVVQSIVITCFAELIVHIIYGPEYMEAVSVLQIIVWYTTFSYLGAARSIWILAEGQQRYIVPINAAGAILNIVLNLYFIPMLGINGAAIASLLTQIFTNVITGFFIKGIRPTNVLMFKSLNPKICINMIKRLRE